MMSRNFLKVLRASRSHEGLAAGLAVEEIERLEAKAEMLFQAVSDFQLRAMGLPSPTLQ